MKKLLLLLMVLGMIFTACEQGGDIEENNEGTPSAPQIELAQQSVKAGFESAEYSVSLTANCSWEAESKNDWIILKTECGDKEEKELRFVIGLNENIEDREGAIVIQDKTKSMSVQLSVKQEAFIPELTLSSDKLQYAFEGGTKEVVITSNVAYEVVESCDWIICEKTQQCIKIIVDNSDILESRTAEVIIECAKYNILKTITITQGAFEPFLDIDKNELIFDAIDQEQLIHISSNIEYKIEVGTEWVHCTINDNSIIVSVSTSDTTEQRHSIITILNEKYKISKTITVTQNGITEYSPNVIFYTTIDNNIITPHKTNAFGAEMISNTYSNGRGIMVFDSKIDSIGEWAFGYCNTISSISIPDNVVQIGDYAFSGCISLIKINIPKSVQSIGKQAFANCTGELLINSNIIEENYYSDNFPANDNNGWLCNSSFQKIIIGNNVKKIGNRVFYNYKPLKNIIISNRVNSIGYGAFYRCSNILSITIPYSVTSIGNSAFFGCENITNVSLSDGLKSIGENSFEDCSNLLDITIPNSVTSIGDYALKNCTNLHRVMFDNCSVAIGDYAFMDCSNLTEVKLGSCTISIGHKAFYNCLNITDIVIPDSTTSLSSSAFENCGKLENAIVGEGIKIIFDSVFKNCVALKSISIGNNITYIGSFAFFGCKHLTNITIPSSVTSIGKQAFNSCGGELFIDSKIIETDFSYDNSPTYNENGWLYGSQFTKLIIGDNVTKIGDRAFRGCSSINSVTISNTVNSIGDSAFIRCSNLENVYIGNKVVIIKDYAFDSCNKLMNIYCTPIIPPAIYYAYYDFDDYWRGSFPVNSGMIIHVPHNSYDSYIQYQNFTNGVFQTNWSQYKPYIKPFDFN